MKYSEQTKAEIFQRVLDDFKNTLPSIATGTGSDAHRLSNLLAVTIEGAHRKTGFALRQAFFTKAEFEYLKDHGRPIIGEPQEATKAEGYITITGEPGSPYGAGDEFVDGEGNLFEAVTGGTLTSNFGLVFIRAKVAGPESKLTADASVSFTEPREGIDAAATVAEDFFGGAPTEQREAYRVRLLAAVARPVVKNPTHPAYDYSQYARLTDGVDGAKSHRLRRGLGTCTVAVWGPDKAPVNAATLANAAAAVTAQRPPNCTEESIDTVNCTQVPVVVSAKLQLADGYGFTDIGGDKNTIAGSSKTEIYLDDVTGIEVDKYIAIGFESRKVESVGLNKVNVISPGFTTAPAAGLTVRAGFPTWDLVAQQIKEVIDVLESGEPLKYGKVSDCFWSFDFIDDKFLLSPTANVAAHVDEDKVQIIVLDPNLDLRPL